MAPATAAAPLRTPNTIPTFSQVVSESEPLRFSCPGAADSPVFGEGAGPVDAAEVEPPAPIGTGLGER